ncbi:MAG: hypothetical protein RLZ10_1288 [Bacteroidota bacterium]|jgi:GT2 family glycosyltransferase
MKVTIAVLLTCRNRKEKTLTCLTSFFQSKEYISDSIFHVFLVDDGSTDGTRDAIRKSFPSVYIIEGDGQLFWNQGMRLAWQKALEYGRFDYFLWLNDDTIMDTNALNHLLTADKVLQGRSQLRLITAACRATNDADVFSYGGRTDTGPVIPNGELQECRYVNGNLVLVPNNVFQKIGILSKHYTHGMGDNDYGLRCIEAGGRCFTTAEYIATCPPNEGLPGWCNPDVPFKERWKLLHSPKGLNIKEYNRFRKRFWGNRWFIFALKAYFRLIFPRFHTFLNK